MGGPVTTGAQILELNTGCEIPPVSDSEPQSLMGVRFACGTLERAMPLIIDEVYFSGTFSILVFLYGEITNMCWENNSYIQ